MTFLLSGDGYEWSCSPWYFNYNRLQYHCNIYHTFVPEVVGLLKCKHAVWYWGSDLEIILQLIHTVNCKFLIAYNLLQASIWVVSLNTIVSLILRDKTRKMTIFFKLWRITIFALYDIHFCRYLKECSGKFIIPWVSPSNTIVLTHCFQYFH